MTNGEAAQLLGIGATAAALLHHTSIVPVFGVGEDDGLHYYVMQYIHGLGLDEVLRELQAVRDAAGTSRGDEIRTIDFSSDGVIRMWDFETRRMMMELPGHTEEIAGLEFSPDDRRLMAFDLRGRFVIWNLASEQQVIQTQGGSGELMAADWSNDGKVIVCAVGTTLNVWNASRGYDAEKYREQQSSCGDQIPS